MDYRLRNILVVLAMAGPVFAQSDIRGHWSGEISTPGGQLGMEVDLDKGSDGWIGSISIPAQGASGMPLEAISFADGKGSFRLKGGPGDPTFTGALSADGKTLDGNFTQGPNSLPLKLSRTGEANVVVPKPSPAVAAPFLGTWEGEINFGQTLHVVLKITNGKSGGEAEMLSPDQGNARIPVSAVTTAGDQLLLLVPAVSGNFQGNMNKEGTEIDGTWTQFGMSTPLNLKKSVAKP
ncbi:MAG TPA: hypothetical protein VGN17_25785 [Bryobacteraceae bacterium]